MSQFAQETAVQQIAETVWRCELCQGWRVGAVPNGGYVLAVAGRTLSAALPNCACPSTPLPNHPAGAYRWRPAASHFPA